MKKVLFAILILLIASSSCSPTSDKENKTVKNDSTVFKLADKHQILLTNSAEFTTGSVLDGASAFLINYQNKVYAITAKHLLGEAGGVDPEIKPTELHKYFESWQMFPRISIDSETNIVVIKKPTLNYDSLKSDLLLLEVANSNYNAWPLQVSFFLPEPGDQLYIIGCPYSEEKCLQNIYPVKFAAYESETGLLISTIEHKIEMAGFSGAPLVNAEGAVVGVVTSSWEEGKLFFTGATFIKKIQEIR